MRSQTKANTNVLQPTAQEPATLPQLTFTFEVRAASTQGGHSSPAQKAPWLSVTEYVPCLRALITLHGLCDVAFYSKNSKFSSRISLIHVGFDSHFWKFVFAVYMLLCKMLKYGQNWNSFLP